MQTAMKWIAGGFFTVFIVGFCALLLLVASGEAGTGQVIAALIAMGVGFWVAYMAKGEMDDANAATGYAPNTYRMGADEEEEERQQVSARKERRRDDWDAIRPDDPDFDGE